MVPCFIILYVASDDGSGVNWNMLHTEEFGASSKTSATAPQPQWLQFPQLNLRG
jgi:hypothetical protein